MQDVAVVYGMQDVAVVYGMQDVAVVYGMLKVKGSKSSMGVKFSINILVCFMWGLN